MKVEIKHRWNGRVLYSAEIEENPLRETVVRAVRENASLDGAYLAGVSLDDYPWIVGLARLGACGTSLTWLIHCASPEGALVALKPAWRDWLADKGAPVAEGAPAVLAWIEREVAKLPPPPKLEAGDLAKYLFAAQPDPACLDNWLTCRCSIARRLRGRVWVAKWKAARE